MRHDQVPNPNPRYWRSPSSAYIVNFEKVGVIFLEEVQISPTGVPAPVAMSDVVGVCIALERADKAFLFNTTREEFEQLMCTYERWLSER